METWEFKILDYIQGHMRFGFLDWLMPKISMLADFGAIWIFFAVAFLCFKRYRKYGFILLISLGLGLLIGNFLLKNIIERARPYSINTTVQLLVNKPTDFSFPSGHTLSSFAAATCITFANKKFAWLAFPLATLIAFSRLYLYLHFLTDVIGGMAIGVVIGVLVNVIERALFSKEKIKKK